jgi:DNA-binding transcriptional regulator YiaG
MKTTTTSQSELARQYNVNLKTLKKWLQDYPELLNKQNRLLTPKKVEQIYRVLGEP